MSNRVKKGVKSWRAVVTIDGVSKTKMLNVRCEPDSDTGKRKALRLAAEWEQELVKAGGLRRSDEDLVDYCHTTIETRMATGQIESSTYRGYRTSLNYIAGYFSGERKRAVSEVTTSDIEGFVVWMADSEGLCSNTRKKTYNVLDSCLRHAVESRKIPWNPCDPVRAPKQTKTPPNALTEESRVSFVRHMDELELTPEVMGVWIAYWTGMRRGEICGLKWSDVELRGEAVARVADAIGVGVGGTYEKDTKAHNTRLVPLPPQLVRLLKERRAAMLEQCLATGIGFSADLYVCGEIDGRYLNPPRLTKWFTQHRSEWNLMGTQGKPVVLHGLRHTYATLAVRALNIKTAQSVLGHKDIQMTMDYADTTREDVKLARAPMADALSVPESAEVRKIG